MTELEGTGAVIERGRIFARDGSRYRVESLDRPGAVSRWMRAASFFCNERMDEEDVPMRYYYLVGDLVWFFMAADGRGLILGLNEEII